ncbi:hypothetical protein EV668_1655 [Enterovirga rhinocerotis]|uniref:Uncharacterized protein n=2 Tax=Enterovirga rhinocerotis TaxID=1339210 RepID=A0A4V3DYX6_9HYPH|nr:hypothetical protein EV668_1655 [Enterovirga rhinocerotis]
MEGDDSQEPFTKDELLELHGRCGNYTHRGRLGSLTLMHSQSTNDFIEMAPTMQRLVDLLSYHAIFFTTDRFWLCHLHTKESQAVQVYEMIRAKSPR